MAVVKTVRYGLQTDLDVLAARRGVTDWAKELGFSVLDRTKVVTAASELARNAIIHGHGGRMALEVVRDGPREGLRMTFEDAGPGIVDVSRALQDGYSTAGGMGLGLPGARRLVNEFTLQTAEGVGTSVTIVRWKA